MAVHSADLVVEATATSDTANVSDDRDDTSTGYTVTRTIVDRVIHSTGVKSPAGTVEKGAVIEVLEPTYVVSNGWRPGVTRYNYEDYTKMEPDAVYVLFLVWDERKNAYWINALEQGKFNVDRKDIRELRLAGVKPQYAKLKKDVLSNTMNMHSK